MKLRSVRFKVSVLYTSVLGAILLVYSLMLYFNLGYSLSRAIDSDLRKKVLEIEETTNLYSQAFDTTQEKDVISVRRALHINEMADREAFQWPSVRKIDQSWRYRIQALGIKHDYVVVYSSSGEVLETSQNVDEELLSILKALFHTTLKGKTTIRDFDSKEYRLRIITHPLYRGANIRYIFQIATPTEAHQLLLKTKMRLILISIPVFLLFTSFLGSFFVLRVFDPVMEITRAARQISYRDMGKRVELKHADDEIKSLVDAFNDMIWRLEKSFRHIDDFSSNVAHELKTPLAIIRGELEVSLRKERTAGEYQKSISIAIEEVQRVLKTINDLLLLAKLDYRTEVFSFEPVELNEFMQEIYEQSKLIASGKKIEIGIKAAEQPLTINANKLHLRRLFFNLIDNAIKFTPREGKVEITLERRHKMACVSVRDTGVGIPADELSRIFERFFHVDRTNEAPSTNGLGLSIVQSIAKIHNGVVNVKSEPGKGSVFTVSIPLL